MFFKVKWKYQTDNDLNELKYLLLYQYDLLLIITWYYFFILYYETKNDNVLQKGWDKSV